jgi:hypothetical protein
MSCSLQRRSLLGCAIRQSYSSTPDSQLGSMCECGRRTSDRIGLISKVHGCNETAVHGEYVENLAIRKNIPLKALDELGAP